jgi:hypothetical protein
MRRRDPNWSTAAMSASDRTGNATGSSNTEAIATSLLAERGRSSAVPASHIRHSRDKPPPAGSPRPPINCRRGLGYRGFGGVGVFERVKHDEVVDDALIAHGGRGHARRSQSGGNRFALVAQHVGFGGDDQRWRKAGQFVESGEQRPDYTLRAFVVVGGVLILEPLHGISPQIVALGEFRIRAGVKCGICNRVERHEFWNADAVWR